MPYQKFKSYRLGEEKLQAYVSFAELDKIIDFVKNEKSTFGTKQ